MPSLEKLGYWSLLSLPLSTAAIRRLEITIGLVRTLIQPYLIAPQNLVFSFISHEMIASRNKQRLRKVLGGQTRYYGRCAPFRLHILLNFYPLENFKSIHASPTGHSLALSHRTALLGTTPYPCKLQQFNRVNSKHCNHFLRTLQGLFKDNIWFSWTTYQVQKCTLQIHSNRTLKDWTDSFTTFSTFFSWLVLNW